MCKTVHEGRISRKSNLNHYITFTTSRLLSLSGPTQVKHTTLQTSHINPTRCFESNSVIRLWNKFSPLELDLPFATLITEVHNLFWDYFISSYCFTSFARVTAVAKIHIHFYTDTPSNLWHKCQWRTDVVPEELPNFPVLAILTYVSLSLCSCTC